jgi:hypothetical protein
LKHRATGQLSKNKEEFRLKPEKELTILVMPVINVAV